MIFDTHAHYDDEQFNEDRESLLLGMKGKGVGRIVNVGASMQMSKDSIALAEKYPFVYAAVGVHPESIEEVNESNIKLLEEMSKHPKCVAIGEIGLDYHYEGFDASAQKNAFEMQIDLADRTKMPIIVHSRDAAKDTYDIMKSTKAKDLKGVVHCFSYSLEEAKKYLEWDYYIGVGGVLTFKNGRKLREVVENISIDRIVLETDCPYLCPVRGSRNDSSYIRDVVEILAQIKGMSAEEVISATYANACRLYNM